MQYADSDYRCQTCDSRHPSCGCREAQEAKFLDGFDMAEQVSLAESVGHLLCGPRALSCAYCDGPTGCAMCRTPVNGWVDAVCAAIGEASK
jgi:hypothetical protein